MESNCFFCVSEYLTQENLPQRGKRIPFELGDSLSDAPFVLLFSGSFQIGVNLKSGDLVDELFSDF